MFLAAVSYSTQCAPWVGVVRSATVCWSERRLVQILLTKQTSLQSQSKRSLSRRSTSSTFCSLKKRAWSENSSNLSPKTQARSCCLNCEKPKPEHFSSFFCAWARRQARAISSFCPRKNIREASKISLQSFWQRSKEKKIVDANRSNSQVKSCF